VQISLSINEYAVIYFHGEAGDQVDPAAKPATGRVCLGYTLDDQAAGS